MRHTSQAGGGLLGTAYTLLTTATKGPSTNGMTEYSFSWTKIAYYHRKPRLCQ